MAISLEHSSLANEGRLTDDEINLGIGRRMRRRRRLVGMTQQSLAVAIGVKFQQIQKYECAGSRVKACDLFILADRLGVPIVYFFDGLRTGSGRGAKVTGDPDRLTVDDVVFSKQTDVFLQSYLKLPERVQASLREHTRALAEEHNRTP